MPPIIPDAPWIVNLVLLVLAVSAPVLITHISTRRRLDKTQADVSEVRNQVQNTHTSNLRDDLDALRTGQERGYRRLEGFVTDVGKDVSALRRSVDRQDRLQAKALEEAIEDRKRDIESVRREISTTIRQHVAGCPARTQAPEKEN